MALVLPFSGRSIPSGDLRGSGVGKLGESKINIIRERLLLSHNSSDQVAKDPPGFKDTF